MTSRRPYWVVLSTSALLHVLGLRTVLAAHYHVAFDGKRKDVYVHRCQGTDARCGEETNNFASHTLNSHSSDADADSKAAVEVVVTSLDWYDGLGDDINIRPSHLVEKGIVSVACSLFQFRIVRHCFSYCRNLVDGHTGNTGALVC